MNSPQHTTLASSAPDEARRAIAGLVERFGANAHLYTGPAYNETQVRREFIDPFFEALGWDVANKTNACEAFKDVVHEDALKVAGSNRAPDYSFRMGGQRVFFVEAKKPAVALKADTAPAFQLRRYAWSANLPVSILTDFEELAVYDTRHKPDQKDDAAAARVLYLRYDQYPDQLDRLYGIFSKQAVLTGGLHRFAEDTRGKRGTTEVSAEFLKTIEQWRDSLAREIALRNPGLADHELNHAVQATIDRLLFLRIAEDRGIEPADTLRDLAAKPGLYPALCDLFRRADERYNAGLFDFGANGDRVCLGMQINDKPLRAIIEGLYYPACPYEFSVIPGDILGAVYEQFLGKVIRLTAGHRAKVEDKPEVRKAGGVYYTPRYIVDYIVEHTVGASLQDAQAPARLTILDPACGSGSFLLGAYEYLLSWHLQRYTAHDPGRHCRGKDAPLVKLGPGDYRLSLAERRRILTDCLFGVDIDPQAVEVTKLNLLLKCMEGENEQTLQPRLLGHERVLPNIDRNIKCGNSLIGWDYFAGQLMPDEAEVRRMRPFDWEAEFPEVMKAGGFDCVIGNPPYIRQEGLSGHKDYLSARYRVYAATADIYAYFMERSIRLLAPPGRYGVIVSNKWLRAAYGAPLRGWLASNCAISSVLDLAGLPVFNATVRTVVMTVGPGGPTTSFRYIPPPSRLEFASVRQASDLEQLAAASGRETRLPNDPTKAWAMTDERLANVIRRMQAAGVSIRQYIGGKPYFGIKTGCNEAYVVDEQEREDMVRQDGRSQEALVPLLGGRDIARYRISPRGQYLVWAYIGIALDNYPAISARLSMFRERLQRRTDQGRQWWELRPCDYYDRFRAPKIIYPDIATECRFALDCEGYFGTNTTYFLPTGDLYLLGVLNSRLSNTYFAANCAGLEGQDSVYLRFFGQYMDDFPIRPIDFSDPADVARHDRMVALVQTMLDLNKRLPEAKTANDRDLIARQIAATDKQIDALVYELYGLTEDEIAIVEG